MPKSRSVEDFQSERERLNEIVMRNAGQVTKRFYNLDSQAYRAGALPAKTKELLGLTTSLVLRCDDCIKYHIVKCRENGVRSWTRRSPSAQSWAEPSQSPTSAGRGRRGRS